jgi:lysophospholipase L1-like esterase
MVHAHKFFSVQPDTIVQFHGIGGLKLDRVMHFSYRFEYVKPDIFVLELGTNDLASNTSNPRKLAQDIYNIALQMIDTYNVRVVVINQIYFRAPGCKSTRSDFNACAMIYNQEMKQLAAQSPRIIWNHHKNMINDWEQYLLPDGIHLSTNKPARSAMFRYMLSIQTAITKATQCLGKL